MFWFRLVLLTLACSLPLTLGACSSSQSQTDHLENEDLPLAFERARQLENDANDQIHKGNGRKHPRKRREHFDRALNLLREARDLYEQEAVENKGTPERLKNIEREMERLSDRIEDLHKIRPI